jgi:hypothetical protein
LHFHLLLFVGPSIGQVVHIQNRCRVRRYSENHETSHLRPFTLGHRKRALGNRPTFQRRFPHAPSPDHPRQSWLNAIEPKWVHGKRKVVEPDGLLGAYELADRVCRVFDCPHYEYLSVPQEVA